MKRRLLMMLVAMMAMTSTFASVHWYLHENFEGGQIPSGWTQEVVSENVLNWAIETPAEATRPATGNESAYYVAMRNKTGKDLHCVTRLISPAWNFLTGPEVYQPVLLLNHAQPAWSGDFDTLKIYYRPYASAAWMPLKVFSNRIDKWTVDTVQLIGYANATAYQLAFECVENMGRGIVLDDIRVRNSTSCTPLSQLTAAFVGSTDVTLSWAGDFATDTFEVVVATHAITDMVNDSAIVHHSYAPAGTFRYTVTGLGASSEYVAYARSHCPDSEEEWMPWDSTTFRTRSLLDMPYYEEFTSTSLPAGWFRGTSMGSIQPTFASSPNYSVDSTFAMQFNAISAGKYAYAATPELSLALNRIEVGFWGTLYTSAKTPISDFTGMLLVGAMSDAEDVNTFEVVDTVKLTMANKHEYFNVSFDKYKGNGRYLAFMAYSMTGTTTFYVDKVTIREAVSPIPNHIQVKNITPDGFDVIVDKHGSDTWNLRIANAADYQQFNASLPSSFLVSHDGIDTTIYHVSASLGDSIIAIYAQGVKNSVASAWSFPKVVRVPKRATLPLTINFAEADGSVSLADMDKEVHGVYTKAYAYKGVYFVPTDFNSFFPTLSGAKTKPVYSGGLHLILRGNDNWFTLPYIDSFEDQGVTFRLGELKAGESRIAVGVMTDPYDLNTFVELAQFEGATGAYSKCKVDLSDYTGTGHYVAFRALAPTTPNANYGSVNHIAELSVATLEGCREASQVKAALTATSATITWRANSMTSWQVKLYQTVNDVKSVVDSQFVSTPTVTFSGLDSLGTYSYQVFTICSDETVMTDERTFTLPQSMPLVETFNSLNGGIPAGWDNTKGTTSNLTHRWNNYNNGYSGKCVRFESNNNPYGSTNYLALPALYLSRDALLRFMWKNPAGGAGKLLISTDGGLTQTELFSALTDIASWTEFEIDLTPYTGQTVNLYFLGTSNAAGTGDGYLYLDEVKVFDKPTCVRSKSLKVSNITGNGGEASWVAGGNETQWQYVCVRDNAPLDWTNAAIVNSPSVVLSGLTPSTHYTLYVRGYCSADDQSEEVSVKFATACGAVAIPFAENFNDITSGVPDCWDNTEGTTTSDSYVWQSYAAGYQGRGMRFNSYSNSEYNTNYLATTAIDLTTSAELSFMWKNPNGGPGEVLISLAGDTVKSSLLNTGLTSVSTWKEFTIDLTPYMGQKVVIYFKGTSNYGSSDAYLYLDNVQVNVLDPNCRGAKAVMATPGSSSTAQVAWTVAGTQEVDIEVSESASFSDATQYSNVTANPYQLTGLTENHTYYVRIRQSCDPKNTWQSTSFKTLCGEISPSAMGVEDFSAGDAAVSCWSLGYTNAGTTSSPKKPKVTTLSSYGKVLYFEKDATYFSSSDTTYYADGLYAILPQFTLDSITHYELTFSAAKSLRGDADLGRLEVGVITDPSDISTFTSVKTLKLDYAADSTELKTYTVSFKDYAGDYNDDFGKSVMFYASVGDSSNHVIVDNVELAELSACPSIVEGVVSDLGKSEATYSWEDTGAASYDVVVLSKIGNPSSDTAVFVANVTTNSVRITGLESATKYFAYVRANCGESQSRWSAHTRFITTYGPVDEFIVADGTESNSYLPINGLWVDQVGTHGQSIYSTSLLEGLVGETITGLHYYSTGSNNSWADAEFDVKLMETSLDTFSTSFLNTDSATIVYSGTVSVVPSDGMHIMFDVPFVYTGSGNLAVEFIVTKSSTYNSLPFIGSLAEHYVSAYTSGSSGYISKFLPKVGFVYQVEPCPVVTDLHVEWVGNGTSSAIVRWTKCAGEYLSGYDVVVSDSAVSNLDEAQLTYTNLQVDSILLTGLNAFTPYYVYVRANCQADGHNDGSSLWADYSFTTLATCPAVVDLESELLGANTVSVSWAPAYAGQPETFAYVCSIDSLSETSLESVQWTLVNDTTSIVLKDLAYDQTYYIFVTSICDNDAHSLWNVSTIKTDAACAPVRNLVAERVEHNRVVLSWERSLFGDENRWEVGIVGEDRSIIVSDTAKVVKTMLVGLKSTTDYTAYVRALCVGNESSSIVTVPFRTKEAPSSCVTIGNGTSDTYYVPFCNWFANSWTQTIYTAAEVGEAGTITSIWYNVTAVASGAYSDNIVIYLAHTPSATSTSWIAQSALTAVYANTNHVYPSSTGWVEIELDQPFEYNGTDNLAVVIGKHASTYSTSIKFAYTTGASGSTVYRGNDSSTSYGDYPTVAGTSSTYKPNIQFCFADNGNCKAVTKLQVKDITTTTAVVSWEPMGYETSWNTYLSSTEMTDMSGVTGTPTSSYVQALSDLQPDKEYWFYVQPSCEGNWKSIHFVTVAPCSSVVNVTVDSVEANEAALSWEDHFGVGLSYVVAYGLRSQFNVNDSTTYSTITVNDTHATLTGLTRLTEYSFAVKSLCDAGLISRFSDVVSFQTACGLAPLPWTEGFESYGPCWYIGNIGNPTSSTYIPTLVSTAAYVHGDSLAMSMYAYSSADSAYAILPAMDFDTLPLQGTTLSFYARSYSSSSSSSSYYNHVLVGVVNGTDISTFSLVEDVEVAPTYDSYEVVFANYTGNGDRIAMIAYVDPNSTSTYRYSRIYVDDLELKKSSDCLRPGAISVDSVSASEAQLSWVAGGGETQWQYCVVNAGDAPNWNHGVVVSSPSVTLSGLGGSTSYDFYLRSYCSASSQSNDRHVSFTTLCGAIALPWSENFNNLTVGVPGCWDNTEGTTTTDSYKWNSYETGYQGRGMRFNSYSNTSGKTNYLATPPINISAAATLTFKWKNPDGGDGEVLISLAGDSTKTSLLSEGLTDVDDWTEKEISLTDYVGKVVQIYFKGTSNYGSSSTGCYLFLDDVRVDTLNSNCGGISNMHVEAQASGFMLSWNYLGGSHDAEIEISKSSSFKTLIDTATVSNVSSYLMTGLQSSTNYYARVRQVCGDGEYSAWRTLAFSTGVNLPYIPTFSSTSFPTDWSRSSTSASRVFGGEAMNTTTSGWSLISGNDVISATHFQGNIWSTSFSYWAVTPAINMMVNDDEGVILSVDLALDDWSSSHTAAPADMNGTDDRFLIAISTDGGSSWKAADVIEWNNTGTGDYVYNEIPMVGKTYKINLSDYIGKVVKIGFYGESTQSNADNDFHFGKIRVERVASVSYTDTLCYGESFDDHGFVMDYTELHEGMNTTSRYEMGSEGTMVLTKQQVYVLPLANDTIPVSLCYGEHWNNYGFDITATKSGVVRQRFDSGSACGCDSTVYLYVTVKPTLTGEEYASITEGESFTWHGHTYYQQTIAQDTTTSQVTGCDSITTLYLTLCPLVQLSYHSAFCAGQAYEDDYFEGLTRAGEYDGVKTDQSGCKSYAHVILHEIPMGGEYVDTVLVANLPYVILDDTVCPVTDKAGYVYHGRKDFGCGMVNVTIYVVDKTSLSNVSAESLQIAPNPVTIGEEASILSSIDWSSDYRCRVYDALGKLVYESSTPSKTLPGMPSAGIYTVRISTGKATYLAKLIVK